MKKIVLSFVSAMVIFSALGVQAYDDVKRPDTSKLCQGKALNTKVSQKIGDRTMAGSCQIGFKANNADALDRGAMRDPAIQNICKGKTKGAAVIAKVDGKSVSGKCDIVFRSDMKR